MNDKFAARVLRVQGKIKDHKRKKGIDHQQLLDLREADLSWDEIATRMKHNRASLVTTWYRMVRDAQLKLKR